VITAGGVTPAGILDADKSNLFSPMLDPVAWVLTLAWCIPAWNSFFSSPLQLLVAYVTSDQLQVIFFPSGQLSWLGCLWVSAMPQSSITTTTTTTTTWPPPPLIMTDVFWHPGLVADDWGLQLL
jgi:hypothetical protein